MEALHDIVKAGKVRYLGASSMSFTMKQYVQTDLEADRQVANTLAELIIGGALASFEISRRMGGKASGEGGGEAA